MKSQLEHIAEELQHHLPYTVFSVATGMVGLGVLTVLLAPESLPQASQNLFHIFHPLHMLFSSAATTAMFFRHNKKLFQALSVGFVGSLGICGLSDIFLPFVSGLLLGVRMTLHICIFAHPLLILPFVFFGLLLGLVLPPLLESTIFSHGAHVLVSSMASIFYLVSFGMKDWIPQGGLVFFYIVLAVMIPCCTSDIVFPLLLTERETKQE